MYYIAKCIGMSPVVFLNVLAPTVVKHLPLTQLSRPFLSCGQCTASCSYSCCCGFKMRSFISFMHLADAFIQRDLHCIQVTVSTFYLAFPGNRTHDLGVASAMLYQLSYRKASLCARRFHTVKELVSHLNDHIGEGRSVSCPVSGCKHVFTKKVVIYFSHV